jgi:hypothetical protein
MNLPQFDGHSINGTMIPEGVSDEKEKNVYGRVQTRGCSPIERR